MTTSTPPPAPHLVWVDSPFHEDDSLQVLAGTEEWLLSPGHTVLCTDSKGKPFLSTTFLLETHFFPSVICLIFPDGLAQELRCRNIIGFGENTSNNETGKHITALLIPVKGRKRVENWLNSRGNLQFRLVNPGSVLTLDIPPADAEAMRQMAALLW